MKDTRIVVRRSTGRYGDMVAIVDAKRKVATEFPLQYVPLPRRYLNDLAQAELARRATPSAFELAFERAMTVAFEKEMKCGK